MIWCISAAKALTAVGLALTLIGSVLLFFYGLPQKKVGTVLLWGIQAMDVSEPGQQPTPPEKWQPIANCFWKKALILNRTGFGLVGGGTLLQIIGVFL